MKIFLEKNVLRRLDFSTISITIIAKLAKKRPTGMFIFLQNPVHL
jgi:hypothetical protein